MEDGNTEHEDMAAPSRRNLLLLTLAFEGGLLAIAVLFGWLLGIRFWEVGMGTGWAILYGVGLSIPPLAIVYRGQSWRIFARMEQDLEKLRLLLGNSRPIDLLFISIMAGVCEEAFFRGFAQEYLTGYIGVWGAIAISSLVFGLFHAVSFSYFIFSMVFSIYLGQVYVVCNGLAAPMTLHAVYDYFALMYIVVWTKTDVVATELLEPPTPDDPVAPEDQ